MFEPGDYVKIVEGLWVGESAFVVHDGGPFKVEVYLCDVMQNVVQSRHKLTRQAGNSVEELDVDSCDALGLDGTGMSGNPFYPFTYGNVKQGIKWVRENGWNV